MPNGKEALWADLDTLKEVANIAAAHAATALSTLTDRTIGITVPDLVLVPLTRVPDGLAAYVHDVLSVEMRILGEIPGRIIYLMTQPHARSLAAVLLGRASLDEDPADGLVESALKETANILGGAYAGALARMTGNDVMLSVPKLVSGELSDLLFSASRGGDAQSDFAFCVATDFLLGQVRTGLEGRLLLVSDPDSLLALIEAVRATAEKA